MTENYPPPEPPLGAPSAAAAGLERPSAPSDAAATPAHRQPPLAGLDTRGHVRRTRISVLWVGLITIAIVLVVLIVFIAQNQTRAPIRFLGFDGHISVGLAMLIAAVCGLLIAAVPGTIRIGQLRKALKRNARTPEQQRE